MSKPALTIEPTFRSGLEKKVAEQLDAGGVAYGFESQWIRYIVPEREAKYLPDFSFEGSNIVIEAKGRFGGGNPKFKQPATDGAKERQKLILLKEQHPELDIRILFSRASTPIYPKSKTTYAKWATDHGFKWAEKVVPPEWLADILQDIKQSKKRK
jgi:Autographiviridae endonuclease I